MPLLNVCILVYLSVCLYMCACIEVFSALMISVLTSYLSACIYTPTLRFFSCVVLFPSMPTRPLTFNIRSLPFPTFQLPSHPTIPVPPSPISRLSLLPVSFLSVHVHFLSLSIAVPVPLVPILASIPPSSSPPVFPLRPIPVHSQFSPVQNSIWQPTSWISTRKPTHGCASHNAR